MQILTKWAVIALLATPLTARADDAADAKAIVEKAIKARGGKLDEKLTGRTWKDKGNFTRSGLTVPYAAQWTFQAPDKYRFVFDVTFGDAKINLLVVVNGEKAWSKEGDKTEELTGDRLENSVNEAYEFWVASLTPLITNQGFTLAVAKGKDVDKKPTVGVKVTRGKHPEITLYFDKESGLLVKREMLVKDGAQKGKTVLSEAFFSEYKEAGGKKHFTKLKVVNDGNTTIESTLSDAKEVEKLDPKLFEKP
jgi:outer membrane lipoprotein-sorting protein